ncbi:MAG: DUF302 domain-containing protein [Mycobacterium sp.]|uniref:DUF302 domain-containing protein n=1 Tax=Mycobacterium sp. TaxID=1785 RepID=UPI002625A360|nr:DUF302 domain-containing protein [Mycobacterium sp.]MDI3315181.1 DUF302 domain-containing protein [Mycobacterium sp.]
MSGWVEKRSPYPVPDTLDRLENSLVERDCTVMARIDHAANAAAVGMDLRPTQVLLFGKPRLGTRLMQAEQTLGIDLPSKVLAWQDTSGEVRLGYRDLRAIVAKHDDLDNAKAAAEELASLIDQATDAAIAPPPSPPHPPGPAKPR